MKRGDAVKIILKGILYAGGFVVLSIASPTFPARILPKLIKHIRYKIEKKKRDEERRLYNAFYYLKRRNLINFEYRGKQLYISITPEGKQRVEKYQIDNLEIRKTSRWDKKWRVLIFDIEDRHKVKRESLRGKLKELGLFQLQKSVWACPYDFQREIFILRNFFGLEKREMKIITASDVEDDREMRIFFGVK